MRKLDINIGDKFGRLTVIKESEPKGKNRYRYFLCKCECGIERDFKIYRLTKGITISCGCFGKELAKVMGKSAYERNLKSHDFPKDNIPHNFIDGDFSNKLKNEYHYIARLWSGIKQRCFNPNEPGYKWYGARGITMYESWINNRQLFKQWILNNLGHRPQGFSIDRINVNGHYEPGNLRWADKNIQIENRRNVKNKK
jgi:hypothetical protein